MTKPEQESSGDEVVEDNMQEIFKVAMRDDDWSYQTQEVEKKLKSDDLMHVAHVHHSVEWFWSLAENCIRQREYRDFLVATRYYIIGSYEIFSVNKRWSEGCRQPKIRR